MDELENQSGLIKITIGKDGTLPKPIFQLNTNETIAIHNAPSPFCTTQVLDTRFLNIQNTLPYCYKITQLNENELYHIIEIVDSILFHHDVVDIVFNWTKDRYTIDNYGQPGKINESRVMIHYYPIGIPIITNVDFYYSISELKKNSLIYKNLSNAEKQWVTKKSNIQVIKDLIYVMNFGDWNSTGIFIQHLYLGTIKKGKFTGIHHIYSILKGNAKIKEIIDLPNKNGVWRARIVLRDNRFNKDPDIKEWKVKDDITTFFPNHWSNIDLIRECLFAFKSKIKNEERTYSIFWTSKTESGINVEILTDREGNILTMYPDWNYESKLY